jgi:hypothetical protein
MPLQCGPAAASPLKRYIMKITKRRLRRIIREAIQSDKYEEKLEAKMGLDITKPVRESNPIYSVRILKSFDFVYGYVQSGDAYAQNQLYWRLPKGRASVSRATDPGYPAEYVLTSTVEYVSPRVTSTKYIPIEEEDLKRYESEGVLEFSPTT